MIETTELETKMKEEIKRLRKEKGWSVNNLSEISGVNESQIKKYEAGSSTPTIEVMIKLCKALDTTPNEILEIKTRTEEEDLNLLLVAINKFSDKDKEITKEILRALILKHSAKVWSK